jgi:hypothetical protein
LWIIKVYEVIEFGSDFTDGARFCDEFLQNFWVEHGVLEVSRAGKVVASSNPKLKICSMIGMSML